MELPENKVFIACNLINLLYKLLKNTGHERFVFTIHAL
jgi:hypothetical protein